MEQCVKCKFWGDGDGTGYSYDAGRVNQCKHHLIDGEQHCSSASYSNDAISKVIVGNMQGPQVIWTRWNFGCNLFVKGKEKV